MYFCPTLKIKNLHLCEHLSELFEHEMTQTAPSLHLLKLDQTSDQTFTHPLQETQKYVGQKLSQWIKTLGQRLVRASGCCRTELLLRLLHPSHPHYCCSTELPEDSPLKAASAVNISYTKLTDSISGVYIISNSSLSQLILGAPWEYLQVINAPASWPCTAFSCDFAEVCLSHNFALEPCRVCLCGF